MIHLLLETKAVDQTRQTPRYRLEAAVLLSYKEKRIAKFKHSFLDLQKQSERAKQPLQIQDNVSHKEGEKMKTLHSSSSNIKVDIFQPLTLVSCSERIIWEGELILLLFSTTLNSSSKRVTQPHIFFHMISTVRAHVFQTINSSDF